MNDGILLINKPVGVSSAKIVAKIKHTIPVNKIGHAGTLDPFAEGLLIIGINEGTKILPFLDNDRKTYIATLSLGKATDTLDCTGTIINEKPVANHSIDEINNVLHSFLGKYLQVPPQYSATKHNGVSMYKLAREGIKVELEPKERFINKLELISFRDNEISFLADVSKGTYIRTLGEDIANKLNEVGHLNKLIRASIGNFSVQDTIDFLDVKEDKIIPIKSALKDMPQITLNDADSSVVKRGMSIKLDAQYKNVLLSSVEKELAIYEYNDEDGLYYSKRGFNI